MSRNINDLIDHYTEQKINGLSFSEIRKELAQKKFDKKTIDLIIKSIDNQVLEEEMNKSKRIKSNELKVIGYVLMIGGGILTISSYFGFLSLDRYNIIAFGPVIAGYLLILSARRLNSGKKR